MSWAKLSRMRFADGLLTGKSQASQASGENERLPWAPISRKLRVTLGKGKPCEHARHRHELQRHYQIAGRAPASKVASSEVCMGSAAHKSTFVCSSLAGKQAHWHWRLVQSHLACGAVCIERRVSAIAPC